LQKSSELGFLQAHLALFLHESCIFNFSKHALD